MRFETRLIKFLWLSFIYRVTVLIIDSKSSLEKTKIILNYSCITNTANSLVYLDDELVDISTSVLPELKREAYSKVQVCAKQRLSRYGSFNTVQTSERIERKVISEPSSPYREEQGICPCWLHAIHQLPPYPYADIVKWSDCRSCLFLQRSAFHLPEVKQLLAAKEMLTSQCVNIAPRLKLIQSALINWFATVGLFNISKKFSRLTKQHLLWFWLGLVS